MNLSSFGVGNFRVVAEGELTILAGSTGVNGNTIDFLPGDKIEIFIMPITTGQAYIVVGLPLKLPGMTENQIAPFVGLITGPILVDCRIKWTAVAIRTSGT